jgi:hypothetical protein
MSSNLYSESLGFFVNILKSSAAAQKTIANALVTVGTNSSVVLDTQIPPNNSYVVPVNSLQIFVIICDGPLNISFSNGTDTYNSIVNSLAILPGAVVSCTLANNNIVGVQCKVIAA